MLMYRPLTTAAKQRLGWIRLQRYLNEIGADLKVGDMKSLPEREAGFTIYHGNGGVLDGCLSAQTCSLGSTVLFCVRSPDFHEEPFFADYQQSE